MLCHSLSHQDWSYFQSNANDCIHQMSFVSYSLCPLSFLSQTTVNLQHALGYVNSSISRCQRYPYQAKQSAVGTTCQGTSSSSHPTPLCLLSGIICPYSMILFPQPFISSDSKCETHKHIWNNTRNLQDFSKHQSPLYFFFLQKIHYFVLPSHVAMLNCIL